MRWPSGETGVWRDLPADRLLVVDEAAGTVEAEPLRRWSDGSRPTMTGAPSPAVVAEELDGGRGPLAGGRPAVVNFWAPWCPPCNEELPELVDLAGRYDGEIDFVGISVELDNLDSVRESIRRFGIPYPQFLADDAVMGRFFGSEDEAALPATFVFDRDGRLRRLFRGAVTEAELDALLASFRDEAVSEDTLRMLAETYLSGGDYAQARQVLRTAGIARANAPGPDRTGPGNGGGRWTGSPRRARTGSWARWRPLARAMARRCGWSPATARRTGSAKRSPRGDPGSAPWPNPASHRDRSGGMPGGRKQRGLATG